MIDGHNGSKVDKQLENCHDKDYKCIYTTTTYIC